MKLATYRDGSRDGQLVVVSRDLRLAHYATHAASRMQQALDDWSFISPQLQDVYDDLNAGRALHAFAFDPQQCMAPLPRAFQWVEAAGEGAASGPTLRQRASDDLRGPCDPVRVPDEAMGIDFGAGLAVVTGDVPLGSSPAQALEGVRLLMLANSVGLRHLLDAAAGPGPVIGWPAAGFSPVAVTPDELGEAWTGGRVHLTLQVSCNGRKVGLCDAGTAMEAGFDVLAACLCQTRQLRAGSIIGSGPLSDRDSRKGHGSIAGRRATEAAEHGAAQTPFMAFGDVLRIEMKDRQGQSVFGAIEQTVESATGASHD